MMKRMKKKITVILCLLCSATIFAEFSTYGSITAGFSLSPASEPIPGDDHFAPPTEFGFGPILQGTYGVQAHFPISLGDRPLFTVSYIRTQVDLSLTPVTVSPRFNVIFAPLPFLNFNAGATIGTGWNFGDFLVGISTYDKAKKEYKTNSAFSTMYFDAYIQGTFMFDIAVFFPGDWNHVVTMASYKLGYTGLTSGGDGTPWSYLMGGSNNANGLNYSASVMLGYQMPIPLQMVGFQASFDGYFFEDDFDTESYGWDPTFMSVSLTALAQVKIAENHSITMVSGFSSRRSFDKKYTDDDPLFEKKTVGREWFFTEVTLLYTYSF